MHKTMFYCQESRWQLLRVGTHRYTMGIYGVLLMDRGPRDTWQARNLDPSSPALWLQLRENPSRLNPRLNPWQAITFFRYCLVSSSKATWFNRFWRIHKQLWIKAAKLIELTMIDDTEKPLGLATHVCMHTRTCVRMLWLMIFHKQTGCLELAGRQRVNLWPLIRTY